MPVVPSSPRALVVDDELAIRSVLRRWFERRGWQVDVAEDGDVALNLLNGSERRGGYQLIIADVRMERLGGAELFRWIVTHRPEALAAFVVSTGDTCEETTAEFLREAACPVLHKPFELAELARLVANVQTGGARRTA